MHPVFLKYSKANCTNSEAREVKRELFNVLLVVHLLVLLLVLLLALLVVHFKFHLYLEVINENLVSSYKVTNTRT